MWDWPYTDNIDFIDHFTDGYMLQEFHHVKYQNHKKKKSNIQIAKTAIIL